MMEVLVVIGFLVLVIAALMLLFPVVIVLGIMAFISYMIFGEASSIGDLVGALVMFALVVGAIGYVMSLKDQ